MATPTRVRLHRGLIRFAAPVAAAVGAAVLAAAPAHAQPTMTVTASPTSVNMSIGGDDQTVTISVTTDQPAFDTTADLTVPLASYGVTAASTSGASCNSGDSGGLHCSLGTITPGTTMTFTVTLRPPGQTNSIPPGSSQNETATVTVNADGASPGSASYSATLTNDEPNSVGSISGSVLSSSTGAGISGATVTLTDSKGRSQTATTDADGNFSWTPSDSQTLAPGTITAKVTADGYRSKSTSLSGEAGQPLTFGTISLAKSAKPTPSASPSPTRHQDASPTPAQDSGGGGLGWVTWLLIILGSLLVIGGVVAIVFLLRKKDDDDGDGMDDGGSPLAQFGPPGPSPYGGFGQDAATAVMPPVPGGDAPTMVHGGPLVPADERPTNVYGTPTQQFNAQPSGAPTEEYGGAGQHRGDATQPWQQSDRSGRHSATTYGASSYPTEPGSGAPTSGHPAPGSGAPTGGYPAPTSGPGYLTPNGTYGAPQSPPDAQRGGQQRSGRHSVDDPTRTWQPTQPPQQPPSQPRPSRPTADETRLDRSDGVDWLDG